MLSSKEIIWYGILWLFISFSVFSVAVWFPNREAISWYWSLSFVTFSQKIEFLFSFYRSLETNFTTASAGVTILTAVLFGLTVVLFVHYIRLSHSVENVQDVGATSIGGLISAFFGIGCASCGSVLAVAILSQFGATGLLLFLPFGGAEFGFLAILLLAYSALTLFKKIRAPRVCEIK